MKNNYSILSACDYKIINTNYFWVLFLFLSSMTYFADTSYGETKHQPRREYQHFMSEKGFFSTYFPKRWSFRKNSSRNVIFSVANAKENVGINVVYKNDLKYPKSIKKFTTSNDLINVYTDDLGWNVEVLNSGETTFWDDDALFLKIIRKLNHLGTDIYIVLWQLCFTHQEDYYIITFSAAETSRQKAISEFEQEEESFEYFLARFRLDDWKRIK